MGRDKDERTANPRDGDEVTGGNDRPDEGLTYVKNAHASGLGSIGRNEEKASERENEDEEKPY